MSTASLLNLVARESGNRKAHSPLAGVHGIHSSAAHRVLYSSPLGSAESPLQFQTFDSGYVESLCAGDRRTQEHFIGYFSELLHIKLRARLHSPHAIEDVCQETFARVFAVLRRDGGLRHPERLGAFVNTVCNHVLFEQYRSASRTESLDVEGRPELPSLAASALDVVSSRQLKEKVRRILLDLAPRDRSLLKAVFLDERDRDEVCLEFGVDREYLRVLLHAQNGNSKRNIFARWEPGAAGRQCLKKFETPARLRTLPPQWTATGLI